MAPYGSRERKSLEISNSDGLRELATRLASRMSSITKATARPVSTIWNASGWPLAEMMFIPRFFSELSWVASLMLLVPAVETIVLPLRLSSVGTLDVFLYAQRLAGMKYVLVKLTCCWRSRLLVVEPHSRSMVPLEISGMRLAEVTSW